MESTAGSIINHIRLADVQQDLVRNIVSIRSSQDLFDDLSNDPAHWVAAQHTEMQFKPPHYSNHSPVVNRPFEEAEWASAIQWPFNNWQKSRFSNGTFGVWYGASTLETTVHETVHHWYHGLLSAAGFENETVVAERKLYNVACHAGLLDLRPLATRFSDLLHDTDYSAAQALGARLHREGHPGLISPSVRDPSGESFVVLTPAVLSKPRAICYLTYRLERGHVVIEREPGQPLMEITP
mgnify:CR=1 FL=1